MTIEFSPDFDESFLSIWLESYSFSFSGNGTLTLSGSTVPEPEPEPEPEPTPGVITGVGRCFNNDNIIKDVEEMLRGGKEIFVIRYVTEPTIPESGYRYEQLPSWCDANLQETNLECDAMVPAIVGQRQGQYMPPKTRPDITRNRSTVKFS